MLRDTKLREGHLTITLCCKLLCVSRDGYYKHKDSREDAEIKANSVLLFCQHMRISLPSSGVEVLQNLCNQHFEGFFHVGRDWLSDLLRANNMLQRQKCCRYVPKTTNGVVNHGFSDHLNTIPKRILTRSCEAVVSDITYIKYKEGFAYLSLTMDAYSRVITGFDLQSELKTIGPLKALKQTVKFYRRYGFNIEGLIFHSDRGSQYVSKEMTEYEASLGIITSVTQSGDPLHNALAERLNGTIKNDWLYNYAEMSFKETKAAITRAIEIYNTARPHRALGMKTPMQVMLPNYPNPLVTGEFSAV